MILKALVLVSVSAGCVQCKAGSPAAEWAEDGGRAAQRDMVAVRAGADAESGGASELRDSSGAEHDSGPMQREEDLPQIPSTVDASAPSTLRYTASALGGGYDRVVIGALDPGRSIYVRVVLRSPSGTVVSATQLQASAPFAVERAVLFRGVTTFPAEPEPIGGLLADGGSGVVQFDVPQQQVFPCSIDVHASLHFPSVGAEPSVSVALDADGLAVRGCR